MKMVEDGVDERDKYVSRERRETGRDDERKNQG
jgi:hypothetical protein